MYDDIPVAIEGGRALMQLADVGLTSLMALDSRLLASMASELGRTSATVELTRRAERLEAALRTLYCPETGLFLNRRADTGEFSKRLSPTLFYPLLTNVVSDAQAQRMLTEHLYNPEEFWGEWVLPSVPRNDAAFADQDYWRGRIWPPMNFLVYLGLHRQNLPAARDLAEKCRSLFLEEWRERRHIHENYSALSGSGCPVAGEPRSNSDPYYHWGALLALIPLIESGAVRFELP
jgi:glycogen debranching enzyme